MKRYLYIVLAVAVIALTLGVLWLRGPATSSQAQAAPMQELEARLNARIEELETQVAALETSSGVPATVAYQGYLVDNGGAPINGAQTLVFRIYGQETGGEAEWTETHNNVPVSDGYFSVMLGEKSADNALIEVFSQPERWIEVRLGTITMPRQKIGAVPYALSVPALGCRVIATATQNIRNNALVPLVFTTEIHNTANCWSPGEPTRLVAPADGYYMAGGEVTFMKDQVTASGRIGLTVMRNDGAIIQFNEVQVHPDKEVSVSVAAGMFYMKRGDYIEVRAYHDLGGEKATADWGTTQYQQVINGWLVKVGN